MGKSDRSHNSPHGFKIPGLKISRFALRDASGPYRCRPPVLRLRDRSGRMGVRWADYSEAARKSMTSEFQRPRQSRDCAG